MVAGDSVRRLYTVATLLHLLPQHRMDVVAFSQSLRPAELTDLAAKAPGLVLRPYSHGAFAAEYKTYEHPAERKAVIIVEMTLGQLRNFSLSKHHVQTLLLTDLQCPDAETCADMREYLVGQVRTTPTFQTVLYNNDLGDIAKDAVLLTVEDIPVRSHFSFGRSQVSTIHWSIEGEQLQGSMPNAQVTLPVFDLARTSLLRQEGIFAALSWLDITTLLDPAVITAGFGGLPLLEEHHGPLTLFWARPFELRSDIQHVLTLESSRYLCIGMGPYLRFEELIEQRIEQFETILVVAEDQNQVSLFGDYFLQKERDSYHVLLYLPDLSSLTSVFSHVFARASNVTMMFDAPMSFPPL